ncbi:nucleoside hydrolase [Agromyces sp. SYSU T00194]|uniref:nucleoside hydrolase n=1 Tax=Agromyces chitinivorans TaxID=3158560 RepID=UPI003396F8CA
MATPDARMPVYLDCDTGIDDAVALAYLLGHPLVDLVGIGTVFGNTSAAQAAGNTLGLLAAAGRDDVPVAIGAHDPLRGRFAGGSAHVHGANGVGGVELPAPLHPPVDDEDAAGMLARLARAHAGRLRVVAVGPATNLALAVRRDPELAGRVHSVTIMGGSIDAPGNVSLVAEANFRNDPLAAAAVLSAPWPVVLVPLDVTMQHTFDEAHRQRLLAAPAPLPRLLGEMLDTYLGFYTTRYGGDRRCALHDPLAAAIAVGEVGGLGWRHGRFHVVDDEGPDHGRVVELEPDPEHPDAPTGAVLRADAGVDELLLRRILG